MAAFILTLIGSLFIGAAIFLVFGAKFTFSQDPTANELRNFMAYLIGAVPFSFVLVFFGLG